jgi:hypothetical protein
MKTHTEAIKRHLALLELGFEQQLDLHGEEDAKDLIDRAFSRVVKERREGPPLQ